MAIGIGVKIGTANSVAVADSEQSWENSISLETTALVGVADFIERVGDPVPMIDDHGQTRAAADIYADAVVELITRLDLDEGAETQVTVVHPDTWNDQAVEDARTALDARDPVFPAAVSWVPESRAVLAAVEHSGGAFADGIVVAYDLGASGLTVTVLATGAEPHALGRPLHLDTVSGNEFDRLLLGHTLTVTGADATVELAMGDPVRSGAVLDDLGRLRNECRRAKESLSVDTDTVVDVRVGTTGTEARIVRDEVEELLRAPLLESVALVREALAAAGADRSGVGPVGVAAVLLAGGGAAIPLVTELLSSTLRLPVVLDPEPASASAAGGALLATAALAAREPTTTALPVAAAAGAIAAASPEDRPLREIIPAPSTPVTEPAPRLSRRKRGTLITLGAAALALVTATGLSVGTGLVGSVGEATPPPAGAATTTATSSQNPGSAPGTTVAGARPGTSAAPVTGAGTRAPGASAGTPGRAATNAPTGGAPAPGTTPGRPAPAPAAPSVPYNPGTPSIPDQNPPAEPEVPDPGTGGNTGGGVTPGGVLEVPGRVLDGTGQVLCGVTGVVC
ncbi:Hsp70 family protein [Gordonia terrae]|uniref:Hsp70 family protein n=1 Tax=Gordonia terrae TaxID=2055 RepID=UPI003F6CE6EB